MRQYIEITGNGNLFCEQNWNANKNIQIDVTLNIKFITLYSENINNDQSGETNIIRDLKWFGVNQEL